LRPRTCSSPQFPTLPVFWACGVTPQAAIAAAKPPFAITFRQGKHLRMSEEDNILEIKGRLLTTEAG
jgi:uncharacterized protein YcsI (UPF0317 family)